MKKKYTVSEGRLMTIISEPETSVGLGGGKEGLVGEEGIVLDELDKTGSVEIHGEIWQAISSMKIKKGQRVSVEEVDSKHLRLKVKPVE